MVKEHQIWILEILVEVEQKLVVSVDTHTTGSCWVLIHSSDLGGLSIRDCRWQKRDRISFGIVVLDVLV